MTNIYLCLLMSVLLLGSCKINRKNEKVSIDQITIYSLPIDNYYQVSVKCFEVKNMKEVQQIIITDKREIQKFENLFFDNTNFKEDSTLYTLDTKVKFECYQNSEIVRTFCMSRTKRILFDDRIFLYNAAIDEYLLSKKLTNNYIFLEKNKLNRSSTDSIDIDQLIQENDSSKLILNE